LAGVVAAGISSRQGERVAVVEAVRWQVEELPVTQVQVTEYRSHRVCCRGCGEQTRRELPGEVTQSAFGPRYQAAVATLSTRYRVSRRDVVELCEQLFGSRISTGTVDALLARASEAPAEPQADLLAALRGADAVNMDETGWRTRGQRRALWGIFDEHHAYLRVAPDRHEDHAKTLLAETKAIVTSDRWWAYTHLPLARRQLCWAHLKRDFAAHAEGLAAEKELGEHGRPRTRRGMFWAWEIYTHTNDRSELKRTIRGLQKDFKPIIHSYVSKQARNKYCRGMARNLIKAWPALWTFAAHPDVQPTNNHAERSLRGAVIYRKLSPGTQSPGGEHRIERLLSVHTTRRLQHRSLFNYLTETLTAHARADPIPTLT
jgi:transposase